MRIRRWHQRNCYLSAEKQNIMVKLVNGMSTAGDAAGMTRMHDLFLGGNSDMDVLCLGMVSCTRTSQLRCRTFCDRI